MPRTTSPTPTEHDPLAAERAELERSLLRISQLVANRLEATLVGPLPQGPHLSEQQQRDQHERSIQAQGRLLVSLVRAAHSLRARSAAELRQLNAHAQQLAQSLEGQPSHAAA